MLIARHLEAALGVTDLDVARAELLAAWQLAPQARLARLIEAVDAKLDAVLPYQLANLGSSAAAKAEAVLAGIAADPRVAPVLLDLFATPPWRAVPALPFWRACCARIVASRDPRVLARLERVALAYPATIPTTVGTKVGGYLNRAAGALRIAIAELPPLDDRALAACDALEAKLGAKPAKRTAGAQITADLEQAVYEAPLDDAPRLVLADHLMQRGDPRGELINLQLMRAGGRSDDTTRARELELLAASQGVWTGRIGMAIEPERFVFHRGFVTYAQLPRTKGMLAQFADDPAWSTVDVLDLDWASVVGGDRAALAEIIARGARGIIGAPTKFLAELDLAKLERIERFELARPQDTALVLDWLATARRPRALGVTAHGHAVELAPRDFEPLLASPHFAKLERLTITTQQPQTWLPLFAPTPLPRLVLAMSGLRVELTRLDRRFRRAVVRQPGAHRAGFPEAAMRHIVQTLRRCDVALDGRTPFYPGMTIGTTHSPNWRLLTGVVDDIELLGR